MGWTRRANPRWANWRTRKEALYSIYVDRHGNTKPNTWCCTWTTGSTRSFKRVTNRQYRIAASLQIKHELEMYDEKLLEDYYDSLDWYDDEPMELPDWWYEGNSIFDEPEPEEPIDPYEDPFWFDDYDPHDDY